MIEILYSLFSVTWSCRSFHPCIPSPSFPPTRLLLHLAPCMAVGLAMLLLMGRLEFMTRQPATGGLRLVQCWNIITECLKATMRFGTRSQVILMLSWLLRWTWNFLLSLELNVILFLQNLPIFIDTCKINTLSVTSVLLGLFVMA